MRRETTETIAGLNLPPGAIRIGATAFVIASAIGFAALFLVTQDLSGSLAGFSNFRPVWALPALGLAAMDWCGSGLRLWLLVRPLGIRLPYRTCVQTAGATAALAYLTPSGTGGGPAQLYGLLRNGVSLGRAVATNFASVTVNLLFLSLAGFGAWFFGAASAIEEIRLPVADLSAARLFEWSALGFSAVGLVVVFVAVAPRLPRALLVRFFGRGPRVRRILRILQELHGSVVIYTAQGKTALLAATLVNVTAFGSRFVLGWVVLRGFGVDAGFWNVVILHVMLQFLLHFMPTPGGAGVAELLVAALMSPFLPSRLLVAYAAVWRFFLAYLTVAGGGLVLALWLRQDHGRLLAAAVAAEEAEATAREAGAEAGRSTGGTDDIRG